jgi:hypothetical protein
MKFNPFRELETMKFLFFMSTLCFFLTSPVAIAQNSTGGPSIPLSPHIALLLFGSINPSNPRKELNCEALVAHSWPFPNAQVSNICSDAETACIRYGLIRKSLKVAKGAQAEGLKKDFSLSYSDVALRLRGCQLAIELTVNNNNLVEAAGYNPNIQQYRP